MIYARALVKKSLPCSLFFLLSFFFTPYHDKEHKVQIIIMKKFIQQMRKSESDEKLLRFEDLLKEQEFEEALEKEDEEDPYEMFAGMPFAEMVEETNLSYAMHMGILVTLTQLMSVILEHNAMDDFASVINKAYKKYSAKQQSKYVSPVIISLWALYDAQTKNQNGNFARLLLELREDFSLDQDIIQIIKLSSPTYPMLYQQIGIENESILLRDIITNRVYSTFHADYKGKLGEIWYTRLLAPLDYNDPYVILSPPHVLKNHSEEDCIAFFESHGISKRDPHVKIKLENFMKYGPSCYYWLDYLLEAFEIEIPSQYIYLNSLPKKK